MKNKEKDTIYFGKKTQNAVIKYVRSKDKKEREKIYVEDIHKVFNKLVENIIFRYDFLRLGDDYESLKQEVVSHLYLNIDKFNPDYGTLAYSYFGTSAKRYLQQKSITRSFESKNIDNIQNNSSSDFEENLHREIIDLNDEEKNKEDKEFISILIEEFEKRKPENDQERKIIEAILYLLKNYEGINIHNKKHYYVLIREFSGLDTKIITKIMGKLTKDLYLEIKKKYINFNV